MPNWLLNIQKLNFIRRIIIIMKNKNIRKKPYKILPNVPNWLLTIPKGDWSTKELIYMTRQSRVNISLRMKAIGVEYEQRLDEETNHWVNVYFWKGAKFYLKNNLRNTIDEREK